MEKYFKNVKMQLDLQFLSSDENYNLNDSIRYTDEGQIEKICKTLIEISDSWSKLKDSNEIKTK